MAEDHATLRPVVRTDAGFDRRLIERSQPIRELGSSSNGGKEAAGVLHGFKNIPSLARKMRLGNLQQNRPFAWKVLSVEKSVSVF